MTLRRIFKNEKKKSKQKANERSSWEIIIKIISQVSS
jgi:hypothetical protein